MSMTDQKKHDLLMEMRPDGAFHDESVCMFCTRKASEEGTNVADEAIFTQEQHEQLLATAVERAKAEARAEADAEVLSLNEQLEAAKAALDESAAKVDALQREIAEAAEAERLAALEVERVAAVEAVVKFSDEQIEKRKTSWVEMTEETFAAYLEDLQVVAEAAEAAKASEGDDEAPKSSFDGTRATAGEEGTDLSVVKAFFGSDLSASAS